MVQDAGEHLATLTQAPIYRMAEQRELSENTSPIHAEYIAAVKAADNGDMDLLLRLHHRYTKGQKS
jgi:hypothetical protein